ncbi:MAG: adenylate/guanylate cyclase domain-containing protein [Chloroflexota bacterium]|nr:adenylate/guanylate cyclase domain-containing protein [Chloroflexota bacterium]
MDALDRFPDQNPNPVLRVSRDGLLLYANAASQPVRRALAVELGETLPRSISDELWRHALDRSRPPLEVTHDHRTFSLLPVYIEDLDFINVYGTDVTGEKVVARFPDQNPNPVFRVDDDGRLLYANDASRTLIEAVEMEVGEQWPEEIRQRLLGAADSPAEETIELTANHRTYALRPVRIPEFGFINVYGTDVTAQKAIDRFPGGNPNPVLRINDAGELLYANDASARILEALQLTVGRPIPSRLLEQIRSRLAGRLSEPIEIVAADLVYELKPVTIYEFGFINLYGTDVTAARQLAAAHRENQRLLLNILPPAIAERLLRGDRVIADRFDEVTLLFADIVDFTILSSGLSAIEVVGLLNDVFNVSDRLADEHGLEKIKTIGDAYMVVGGLPEQVPDHAERVADMALALGDELSRLAAGEGQVLSLRMGIHLGPAVAGVIGTRKFIYDVWGDTVNTASRMESHGVPGRVQVTEPVFRRLAGAYRFERRGVIDVKGKGPMETWFLLGRR